MRIAAALTSLALLLALPAFDGQDAAAQRRPPPADKDKPEDRDEPPLKADLNVVILQGLDKVTAKISTFGGRVGQTVRFRSLEIVIRRCQRNRPENPPERGAFLEIFEKDPQSGERKKIFSGWMFASNPALNALEHPIYDVWLKDCK